MSPLRILAVGDVDGKIETLLKKVNAVTKKSGAFDAMFCTGSFFAADGSADETWQRCVSGVTTFPVPTYILGPITEAQAPRFKGKEHGGDLCPNVTYLGDSSITTIAGGLKVASLSGVFEKMAYHHKERQHPFLYCQGDVKRLVDMSAKPGFHGVDILLTSRWPNDIAHNNQGPVPDLNWLRQCPGSQAVAKALRPRYHFAGGAVFFERSPYRNHGAQEAPVNVTRFLGMAPVGNPVKAKWIYACSIVPRSEEDVAKLVEQPQGTTDSPFAARHRAEPTGFFWAGGKRQHGGRGGPKGKKRPPVTQENCWFCLGSPKVEKHLVASVSKDVYLALPKGQLCEDHVLIVPVKHCQSTLHLDDDIATGVNEYKKALRKFFAATDRDVVFFERNFRSDHMQLQAVPVPRGLSDSIELAARSLASRYQLQLDTQPAGTDLNELFEETTPYFMLELPSGQLLIHGISGRFPLQYGREILAHAQVLNCPDKIDWKACSLDKEGETAATKAFREAFRPHDPFLKKKAVAE